MAFGNKVAAVVVEYTLADGTTDITSGSIGDLLPGAAEFLTELKAAGFDVLLVSAIASRISGITAVSQWAYRNHLTFDDVYTGVGFPACDVLVFGRATPYTTIQGVNRAVANV